MVKIIFSTDRPKLERLLRSRTAPLEVAEAAARRILDDVRRHGDNALVRWTKKLDGVDLAREGFTVTRDEIRRAEHAVPAEVVRALRLAARNIRAVARRQLPREWFARRLTGSGVRLGQLVRPLGRVACYVPGGRFPLPSTALMSVIPAQVAGVGEIFLTSPRPAPAVVVAAGLLGVEKIFRLGGAQAIAAFAYGTESVPRVEKIVGPGNRFVAAAKKLIADVCAIDFVAGPTELIVVGTRGRARWIAADLVAQAEHDPDALALFLTPSRRLAGEVRAEIRATLGRMHLPVAEQSLARRGAIVVTRDLEEALDLADRLAPEHLMLLGAADRHLARIHSAGSVFLGAHSAVAAGDYATGSNHILPTAGAARLRGGLTAADFVKTVSVQRLTRDGLRRLRPSICALARAEGLRAHAFSVETRFSNAPTP